MVIFPGASSMPIIYHQTLDMGNKKFPSAKHEG